MSTKSIDRPAGLIARVFPWLLILLCAVYVLSKYRPAVDEGAYNLNSFGQIPIISGGRIKPLDSEARTNLLIIHGKQSAYIDGQKISAIEWLTGVLSTPDKAVKQAVFRIDHPDIITLLKLDRNEKYFSYEQILSQRQALVGQLNEAGKVDHKFRNPYQSQLMSLSEKLGLFNFLRGQRDLFVVPPTTEAEQWSTLGQASEQEKLSGKMAEMPEIFFDILRAYHNGDSKHFNHQVGSYHAKLARYGRIADIPVDRVRFESLFNNFSPFVISMTLYVIIFVLSVLSWLFWREPLGRATIGIMAIALLVHSFGIIARMYIQGRPPVTNLYSSAVFVGWAAVALALVLEYFYRKNIGGVLASVIGFATLILAHHLGGSGDTMQSMQAVLDSNFWLATHVVTISLGYMATYVAGLLAIVYVLRGVFSNTLDNESAKALTRMAYGSICFALLFSFIGTILGGIWADQSWGRFWGWDPKENGALMIVLWNALILHARWGGVVKQRGFMVMAILGNIVTTWSWFGTNLLGVGLHSYGFMEGARFWMLAFNVSQFGLMSIGLIPLEFWRSFAGEDKPKVDSP